ncbi:MAG: glycosyltransferase family 2 protein [Hyphomicrobium sp.]|uniref:glycosyltransferase family 2 protein n=1 Tax=Hyphomicrobium sp. TaxID=82 RepID=UPI0039E373C9
MRTVVCHFFNEEYLLPWWLAHHRRIFDHGIMIDYNSTDKSRELINKFCPTWEIHATRNAYFDSACIDREVEDYERTCDGWRMALNVTEFLYGNVAQLDQVTAPTQHFIGNYVFVAAKDAKPLVYSRPLHEQVTLGYHEDNPATALSRLHRGCRASRSLHNYPIDYAPQGGRHWAQRPTLKDVMIFYYGYAVVDEASIARKLQIKTKMSPEEQEARGAQHPNMVTRDRFLTNIERFHRPRSWDMKDELADFIEHQYAAEPGPLAVTAA